MLFSKHRKFVFIEVPKTGTSSIADFFLDCDKTVLRNKIELANGMIEEVPTHASAEEVRSILGDTADSYTFIAFIRDTNSLLISKYAYYKSGRGYKWAMDPQAPRGLKLRVLAARKLPFWLWLIVYPYKLSTQFICDRDGRLLVDKLGKFENLQHDFKSIFSKLGYPESELTLPISNKSKYTQTDTHIPTISKYIVARRTSRERQILDNLRSKDW